MTTYKIIENYRQNDPLRNEFFTFIRNVFGGLDFEKWYLKGFWNDQYIPYSFVKDDQIIANVSVCQMQLLIEEKEWQGIQLGAVATLPKYRKQGLSRKLMNYVINQYQDTTNLFFLFANDTVLDFYPKFGFKPVNEVIFKYNLSSYQPAFAGRKLNIHNKTDFQIIKRLINERRILTKIFGAKHYSFITAWHLINIFSNNIIYLERDDVIFVAAIEGDQLHIWDVIFTKEIDLSKLIPKIVYENQLKSILYYFPPDQLEFSYDDVIPYIDSPLFILGDFPIVEKMFKFPTTAQT